jgi:hypothetical protein
MLQLTGFHCAGIWASPRLLGNVYVCEHKYRQFQCQAGAAFTSNTVWKLHGSGPEFSKTMWPTELHSWWTACSSCPRQGCTAAECNVRADNSHKLRVSACFEWNCTNHVNDPFNLKLGRSFLLSLYISDPFIVQCEATPSVIQHAAFERPYCLPYQGYRGPKKKLSTWEIT